MYLKSIEMQGFKSFADKTKVVFDQGVTAVVGPNGSGKSNITESLRWALGESSAKSLRGGKMPDVIFAGTESRRALNYASVIVTLDNSDGFIDNGKAEIRVERHIYRSGDSEYRIDGQKVRLRDIHDLFMDTGLGRDSFSIISQGRVEAIFNSKAEERRLIFEEAAGVLKYKTRKKETELKLTQTQDNLDRLEDIIYELEAQVAPLAKQAEVAKRFMVLDAEREKLQLDVLVAQILKGRAQLQDKTQQLEQIKAELSAYHAQRNQLEKENQALKAQRQLQTQTQTEAQAKLLELTRLISDLERRIDLHKLESSQNATSQAEAQTRLEQLNKRQGDLQQQLDKKRLVQADLKQQLATTQTQLQGLEQEIADFSENPDQMIENLREKYVALLQTEADVSNQVTTLEHDLTAQLSLSDSKSAELKKLTEALAQAQALHQESEEIYQAAKAQVATLLAAYQETQSQLVTLEQDYKAAQTAMFDTMDELKNKGARQASLEAIQKNHANFYAGVKAVLQQASQLGGIIGAVSENLTFSPEYQQALEIALGGASQHIIVETEAHAKRAIEFLKKNRQGRATFLPLTTIKGRQLAQHHAEKLKLAQGFLGMASDLVTFDAHLTPIFQNLLGLTAIFDTIEHANQAARQTQFQVRIVTLDGTELRPGGAFSGGANRNQNSIFIQPELDALASEITQLKAQLQAQEKQVETLKAALDASRQQLADLQSDGELARMAEQKAELTHQQTYERLADLTEAVAFQQNQTSTEDLSVMQEKLQALKEQLQVIDIEKTELMAQIDQVKNSKDSIQERLQTLQQTAADLRMQQTELTSEMRFARADSSRLSEELTQVKQDMADLSFLIDQKAVQMDTIDIEDLEKQLNEASQEKVATNQLLIRLKFELEDIEGQFDDLSERLNQARAQNDDLIRSQTRLETELDQLKAQLKTLMADLTEAYKMSFDEAQAGATPLEDLALAEQSLRDLQRKIKALGPVNLEAIDQYEEVNQRLSFLLIQRDDVMEARDMLLATINDMDDEVKLRFKSTFDAIRESFKQTFSQMFGGGSADLILTTPDLLTAGVEISVQPPGKKIQSLNLMSGGEKALSALALLFAIIRVKTIPFVILDEVEAALDEANVKRFGDYLNRFDKSSQFIVVTHRKGTMAAADAIYGVTMQESGVSKVVSVKLKDVETLRGLSG